MTPDLDALAKEILVRIGHGDLPNYNRHVGVVAELLRTALAGAAGDGPIDEAWLRSIGFADMTFQNQTVLAVKVPSICDAQWLEWDRDTNYFDLRRFSEEMEEAELPPDIVEVTSISTRAGLLQFLAALNITLPPPPAAHSGKEEG